MGPRGVESTGDAGVSGGAERRHPIAKASSVADSDVSLTGCFERALVVEDDELVQSFLCRTLRRWGTAALGAGSVRDGLAALVNKPDLVLVDVRLPDGLGTAVAAEAVSLRHRPLVLGMSAVSTPSEAFDLSKVGVRAFLNKPFAVEDLAATVASALVAHEFDELRAGRARKLTPPTRAALDEKLDAFACAHGLVRGQLDLLRKLVDGTPRAGLAQALGVTENTAKGRVRRLLTRCQAERTGELVGLVLGPPERDALPSR